KSETLRGEMLKGDGDACALASEVRNYVDPHFRNKNGVLQLSRRMALAGMLCRAPEKVDEVGLFCVVKKAELIDEEPEGTLRLAFDQRRSDARWRAPPWCAMGAVSATSFLDVSQEVKEGGAAMRFGKGDLPCFVLPGVSGDGLGAVPPDDLQLPGNGACAWAKVALAGFSRACRRLTGGGPLPQLSGGAPAAHYERIEDFGIIGLHYPALPGQKEVATVEEIWLVAKELVMAAGFKVHRGARSSAARMIGGDFEGARLALDQDKKMWLAVLGTQETLTSKWELPDSIARIAGIVSRGRETPREVLRELAAAAAIAPSIAVDLATPWNPTTMMLDASLHGGTIIATSSTVEEQRREARCAVRGGWAAWTGISPSWVAGTWCEGEAFERAGDDVELGARVRAPPVHECWSDIIRWGKRHLRITVSMVCLGGFSKGRTGEPVLPGHFALKIEALADVAELDPFQPLRMGVSAPVRELRFAHLCSGRARAGVLEDWLLRVAASRGRLLLCASADIGFGAEFDLTDEVNVRGLVLLAEMETDGGHSGPSCSTWSRARFQPGGPPPLRLRRQPCGRPGPRGDDAKRVELGGEQLLSSLRILKPIALKGAPISVEYPAELGCPPFPSICVTKELMGWGAVVGAYRVTFSRCMRGCPALKMAAPTGAACAMQRFEQPCEHSPRGASLCGKGASGQFRTRVSRAYPSEFCRVLAERRAGAALAAQERLGADLTERALGQLISETLERGRRGLSSLEAGCVGRTLSLRCVRGLADATQAGAAAEERHRHRAQRRKMGNAHRGNESERVHSLGLSRPKRPTRGLALLPFSACAKTALGCYAPYARRFLDFALEWDLPMMSREEIDDSVFCYLGRLAEDEEVGPHRGDFAAHELANVWQELSSGLPRSNRALRAWHRLHAAGEAGPPPLEWRAVLGEATRLSGDQEAADAPEVALDAYLRSAELFGLRAADVVIDVDSAGEQAAALRLGVPERGERAKTGTRQGELIDRAHVADMLVRRAGDDAGAKRFPPRAARHSGPSRDAATGCRAARAIQRRGRWASEKSALRCMKARALVAARAALPPDPIERGARLMEKKGACPMK
ncbi:unnamed protein product, partial [Prorocentrum cordatum]